MTLGKLSIYHSELRARSADGPVRLMFTGLPRESKYPNKPPFCTFQLADDSTSYTLTLESDAVRETVERCELRQFYDVRAFGAKDAAVLEVEPVNGSPVKAAEKAPTAAPESPSLSRAYWGALDAAVAIVEAFKKRRNREPSDAERAIACTLWIEQNRSAGRRPLCTKEG